MTRRTSHSLEPRSRAPPLLADFFKFTSSHGPFSLLSRQFHNIAWLRMVQHNSCGTWRCLIIRHLLCPDRNSPGLWKDDQGWLGTENILPLSDRAREYSTVELFSQLFYNAGQLVIFDLCFCHVTLIVLESFSRLETRVIWFFLLIGFFTYRLQTHER